MKTPQEFFQNLNDLFKLNIYLKREDLHVFGSHKGRSIPLMIKKYLKEENISNFVISSSGNAALASIHAIQNHNINNDKNIKLTVFVGLNINEEKLNRLIAIINNDKNIELKQIEKPKQSAFQIQKNNNNIKFLRQSTDDTALIGYGELAKELTHIPNLKAVFIPTSSGTTAEALGTTFEKMFEENKIEKLPELHIIQTSTCHPIAEIFDKDDIKEEKSIAGAIVDKIAHRKEKVIEKIKKSSGSAWIVNNEEIKIAQNIIKDNCDLAISTNSALSIAGLIKAKNNNWNFKKEDAIVCLITGL